MQRIRDWELLSSKWDCYTKIPFNTPESLRKDVIDEYKKAAFSRHIIVVKYTNSRLLWQYVYYLDNLKKDKILQRWMKGEHRVRHQTEEISLSFKSMLTVEKSDSSGWTHTEECISIDNTHWT